MESWRNRKTLILSRTDMMGLVSPAEYVGCVEQAYRMHGEGRFYMDPKGHIVLDKYPGEWEAMPSYIEEPEAAACKWVSIRERNRDKYDLPTVFSISDLYASRNRLSAGDLRWQLSYGDADGRCCGRIGEAYGTEEFETARHRGRRAHGRRARLPPATKCSNGTRSACGAARRKPSIVSRGGTAEIQAFENSDID